jgi:putative aldouronate transport system substrate-binding protein
VQTGNLKRADGQKFSLPFTGYSNVLAISKQRIKTDAQLDETLAVLDKLQSREGTILLTNGIEGRNFKVEGEFAVPINETDPQVKVLKNDVDQAFIQLGTKASVGMEVYKPKPVDEAKFALIKEREPLMVEDLKTAVHNPALGVVAPTAISVGANIEKIVSDARVKYLSGTIDEAGLKAEIKRWYDGGGTKIAEEVNQLVQK